MWITGTSLNVVSFLGAIIGVGIVAKNGILMLDLGDHFIEQGLDMREALIRSGRRRLRPVLMTSIAAAFGMLPLAYGIGSGADLLRPLAIAVIGSLCVLVLLSLVATPDRVLRRHPRCDHAFGARHARIVQYFLQPHCVAVACRYELGTRKATSS